MKRDYSPYPIGQVLVRTFQQSNLRIGEFAKRCGYTNVDKGINAFDVWMKTGNGSSFFLEQCITTFQIAQDEIATALEVTEVILAAERKIREAKEEEERQREAERIDREGRASFHPFIEAQPENLTPSSYTFYGLTGGRRRLQRLIEVSLENARTDQAFEHVRERIIEHMAETRGRTFFQGRIIGYWYFFDYDQLPLRFTIEGMCVGQCEDEIELPPSVTVCIGKVRMKGGFFA